MISAASLADRRLNPFKQETKRPTSVAPNLSPCEVDGLNTRGTFVDGIEPIVAIELLDLEVASVACTTVHPNGEVEQGLRHLRRPALRRWG